jgi:hypothetical protein
MKNIIIYIIILFSVVAEAATLSTSNLTYLGAFRVPQDQYVGNTLWFGYGGNAIAYRSDGNGGAGSLYIVSKQVGVDRMRDIGEITIPTPVINSSISSIPIASILNSGAVTEVTEGAYDSCLSGAQIPRMAGLLHLNSRLFVSFWDEYNVGDTDLCSTGYASPNLSGAPNFQGAWWLDDPSFTFVSGKTGTSIAEVSKNYSGWLLEIPSAWATTYVSGKLVAHGQSRAGGNFCRGPTMFASAINDYSNASPPPSSKVPAKALLCYDSGHSNYPNWTQSDFWYGGAWIESGSDSAVLFVGQRCQSGDYYDHAYLCSGGWEPELALYSPADIALVAQGSSAAYTPVPTEVVKLSTKIPYHLNQDAKGNVAYDRTGNKVYVIQGQADGVYPLVHVFEVSGGTVATYRRASGGGTIAGSIH